MLNTSANITGCTMCYRLLTGTVHMSVAAQLCYHRSNSTRKPTDTVLRGLLIHTAIPDDTNANTKKLKNSDLLMWKVREKNWASYNCSVRKN
jgi:hypothetical protein